MDGYSDDERDRDESDEYEVEEVKRDIKQNQKVYA